MRTDRFKLLEEQSQILRKIAGSYPHDSLEYAAVENAAFALVFALSERYEEFTKFVSAAQAELSPEQLEHLRKLGVKI